MMNETEVSQVCAFHRRSFYDVIQTRQADAWGPAWTFAACDLKAAEKTAAMLKRMGAGQGQVRHSRRACLQLGTAIIDAAIVTELPSIRQIVIRLDDGSEIGSMLCLRDECLEALEHIFEDSVQGLS